MRFVLFFAWLSLCSWLITQIGFIKKSGISAKILVTLFLLNVAAGFLNGVLTFHYIPYSTDPMMFHSEGLKEYHLLFHDPKEYFADFFRSPYATGYSGFFQSQLSYWNDMKSNTVIKLLSVFDIFSFGYYYTNVIFYNFLVFFGHIALYRVFTYIYKDSKKLLLIACFLLPSLCYFSSSIHKEGLILLAISMILYCMYTSLNGNKGFTFSKISVIILSLCFIFLQRNFVLTALLPALLAWLISNKRKYPPLNVFLITYFIGACLFFAAGHLYPKLDLPEKVVQKQAAFLSLPKANSDIGIDTLRPTLKSFAANAPQALNHSLLRPYLWEGRLSKVLYAFGAELFLYELMFVLFVFFRKTTKGIFINMDPAVLLGLFFSLSVLLITGYTVQIIGAIVRYRSIYLPFILIPIICNTDWIKIKTFLRINK